MEILHNGKFIPFDNYSGIGETGNVNFVEANDLCKNVGIDTFIKFKSKASYIFMDNEEDRRNFFALTIGDIGRGFKNKDKRKEYLCGVYMMLNDYFYGGRVRALAGPSELNIIEYSPCLRGVA